MAELLIYNKTVDWMDSPSKNNSSMTVYERNHFVIDNKIEYTTAQKIKAKDLLTIKYNARHQIGDIVEARRDNGPRGKLEEASYIFVQVPSISLKDAIKYSEPLINATDVMIRRRKYFMDMTGLIPDSHKNVALTGSVFNSRLKVKT